ncbi:MAG: energy transducer TonB [Acidobacteria bacterium]|nr:energy transducer TonB [Acidobacteriota bacterium]
MTHGFIIITTWCLFFNPLLQDPSEKLSLSDKHVAETKRILASELDAALPKLPFENWFGKTVGREAGVIWQLSECGERLDVPSDSTDDMRACTEANAILPDGRKVVVMILVGTFKKGMARAPEFYYGVIEQQEELYMFRQLRDLPRLLQSPDSLVTRVRLPVVLPKVAMDDKYRVTAGLPEWIGEQPDQLIKQEELPPPPSQGIRTQQSVAVPTSDNQIVSMEPGLNTTTGPPKLTGSVLWGDAITKVQPRYPANAKRVMASGRVEVQVTISKDGRVIAAKAISGHPVLHDAAVEAARQWVFKPATLNGVPVETLMVMTFEFKSPQ